MPKAFIDYVRPRKYKPRKEFNFIPSKEQQMYGALKDLGKPLNYRKHKLYAKLVASVWDEEIE